MKLLRSPIFGAAVATWVGAAGKIQPAARRSVRNVNNPATVPANDGIAYASVAVGPGERGREPDRTQDAQADHADPRPANRDDAQHHRRHRDTATMPSTSAVLSSVPNVRIAKLLTPAGDRSIAALPTAMTGEEVPPTTPAAPGPRRGRPPPKEPEEGAGQAVPG